MLVRSFFIERKLAFFFENSTIDLYVSQHIIPTFTANGNSLHTNFY